MTKFIFFLIFILMNISVFAEDSRPQYLAVGRIDCGQVITASENIDATSKQTLVLHIKGFISGVNWVLEGKTVGGGVSDDQIYFSLLNYCKDNPLSNTIHAAEMIYADLMQRTIAID